MHERISQPKPEGSGLVISGGTGYSGVVTSGGTGNFAKVQRRHGNLVGISWGVQSTYKTYHGEAERRRRERAAEAGMKFTRHAKN